MWLWHQKHQAFSVILSNNHEGAEHGVQLYSYTKCTSIKHWDRWLLNADAGLHMIRETCHSLNISMGSRLDSAHHPWDTHQLRAICNTRISLSTCKQDIELVNHWAYSWWSAKWYPLPWNPIHSVHNRIS
jgi:hypothetical protein